MPGSKVPLRSVDMSFTVTDHPEAARYELNDGSNLIGVAEYQLRRGSIIFTHTKVSDAYEGQGAGGQLAREALDDARRRGLRVVAWCPFIAGWIERHPDYADLLR
jgi:uncharacterized protein